MIFLMYIENYFFLGPRIIFSRYRELIFWPAMHCGPCSWRRLVRVFHFLGVLSKVMPRRNIARERNERNFHLFLQNLRGTSGLCKSDEVFWTEDLIEETTKWLQDSYTILTFIEHEMYVCPNEQSPTQSCTSSIVLHMLAFGTKTMSMRVSPILNLRKKLPILIHTGGH